MEISKSLDKVEEIKGEGGERVLIGLNKLCLNEHFNAEICERKSFKFDSKTKHHREALRPNNILLIRSNYRSITPSKNTNGVKISATTGLRVRSRSYEGHTGHIGCIARIDEADTNPECARAA